MKKYFMMFAFVAMSCLAFSQGRLTSYTDAAGLYGYKDGAGNVAITAQYESCDYWFSKGVAYIKKDELYGYIDSTGKTIVSPRYTSASGFTDATDLARVELFGAYGMIDRTGREVIPVIYNYLDYGIHEGLIVASKQASGNLGFIDAKGNMVIDFIYDDATHFSEGLANVKKGDYWGFINKSGAVVIPFEFGDGPSDDAYSFDFGQTFIGGYCTIKQNGFYGAIDKSGNTIIPFKYNFVYSFNENGIAVVNMGDGLMDDRLVGLVNKSGVEVVPLFKGDIEWNDNMKMFRVNEGCEYNSFLSDCLDGKIGYYDAFGKPHIPCEYDNTETYLGGFLEYSEFLSTGYSFTTSLADGLINISKGGKWGYIDANGKMMIPFQYDKASQFKEGKAYVQKGEEISLIDITGKNLGAPPKRNEEEQKEADESMSVFSDALGTMSNWDWLSSDTTAETEKDEDDINTMQKANWGDGTQTFHDAFQLWQDTYANLKWDAVDKTKMESMKPAFLLIKSKLHYAKENTSGNIQKAARYYYLLNQSEYAVYVSKFSVQRALQYYDDDAEEMVNWSSYDFPLTFTTLAGTNWTISYDNYKGLVNDYFLGMGECEFIAKKYEPAIDHLKKGLDNSIEAHPFDDCYYPYALAISEIKTGRTSSATLDQLVKSSRNYFNADAEDKTSLDNIFSKHTGTPWQTMLDATAPGTNYQGDGTQFGEMAALLDANGKPDEAFAFYKKASERGNASREQLFRLAELAQQKSDFSTGLSACDKLYVMIPPTDCDDLSRLALLYQQYGNSSSAKTLKDKADNCFSERAKAEKKEARQSKNNNNSYDYSNGDGAVYFGVDVFPLCYLKDFKRDYGFVLGIMGNRTSHQFYYQTVHQNRDFMLDVNVEGESSEEIRWNGFTAHYALGFRMSDDFFVGPCFRYKEKNYVPITTTVTDNLTSIVSEKTFEPVSKQYELLLNYSFTSEKPGIAAEMYFGFGAKYIEFDGKADEWLNDSYTVTNPVMEKRKATRWGMAMRVGFTVGIKIG